MPSCAREINWNLIFYNMSFTSKILCLDKCQPNVEQDQLLTASRYPPRDRRSTFWATRLSPPCAFFVVTCMVHLLSFLFCILPWSQCSRSCEGGNRTRSLKCMKLNANGMLVSVSDIQCAHAVKPNTIVECNTDVLCPRKWSRQISWLVLHCTLLR